MIKEKFSQKYLIKSYILNTIKNYFYSRTLLPDENGCMIWTGKLNVGYGLIRPHKKKQILAHRFSYFLHHGILPKDKCVLHKCDNRKCVAPEHLFLGNRIDNNLDMNLKGRHSRGMNNGTPKLSDEQVKCIKKKIKNGEIRAEIARQFHISHTTIYKIASNKIWKHIICE